jgi:hypothetical protein
LGGTATAACGGISASCTASTPGACTYYSGNDNVYAESSGEGTCWGPIGAILSCHGA